MGTVLVSLQEVPLEVRMKALHRALTGWVGEPELVLLAVFDPSDRRYPVDEDAHRTTVARWRRGSA